MLKQHHLIHHDLKPQNIVYNTRMKIIDFGKLIDQTNVMRDSTKSVYRRSQLHFNYPPELHFINHKKYIEITSSDKDEYIDGLADQIDEKCPYLFKLIKPVRRDWFYSEFANMILNDLTATNYNEFLKKTVDAIDVYGVGLTFLFVLQYFEGYMPDDIVRKMRRLFQYAAHPNVFLRPSPEKMLSDYDAIWQVSSASASLSEIKLDSPAPAPAPASLSEIKLDSPPVSIPKTCQSNKEWNPKTRRCNKKCGKNSHRNENFKCVRNTKRKK